MPENWNKTVSIQEAKAAYAVGDDLGAYCFLYEGDRVRPVRTTVSGDIVTLPPYVPPATLYTKPDRLVDSLIADIVPVQSGSGNPSPDNVRPISGWTGCNITVSPTLDAENRETYSITFPSEAGTVYGGTLDVTTGVLTVDRAIYNAKDFRYSNLTTLNDRTGKYVYARNVFSISDSASISNRYKRKSVSLWESLSFGEYLSTISLVMTVPNSVTTIAEATAYFEENETFIVNKIAAPITYQLAPTEVTLLSGETNIFADTGPIILTYVETQEV
jgi:hypothetical protein